MIRITSCILTFLFVFLQIIVSVTADDSIEIGTGSMSKVVIVIGKKETDKKTGKIYFQPEYIEGSPKRVTENSVDDYIMNVLPNEMHPALFSIEALKAQAVAARTYVERHQNENKLTPCLDSRLC